MRSRFVGNGTAFVIVVGMAWRGLSILALVAVAGCAQQPKVKPQPVVVVYEDRPAAALAYAPPVADYAQPLADVDRGARQPRAFIGYESGVTEFFWIRTDDRIRSGGWRFGGCGGNFDRFERRAITTRVGSISR